MLHPSPRLYWNVTPSVPVGLYWITAHEATRGDLIIAPPPDTVRAIADSRGYIPAKIPLLKRIAAVRGDDVCASQTRISINGKVVAQRLEKDQAGRAMPWWTGCRTLGNEVFLLLTDVPTSFDGRYFGPIPRASVIGKAKPLWTY
jgi:conjugative transfer signal peptidase TraF